MTEQEQKDLDEMKAKINEIKIRAFDALVHASKTPNDQLQYTGYITVNECVVGGLNMYNSDIKKLINAHLKKYPD